MTLAELRLYGKSALAQAATAQNAMCAMAMIILTFGQRHKSDGLAGESHGNLKGVGWLRAIGVYAIIDGGYKWQPSHKVVYGDYPFGFFSPGRWSFIVELANISYGFRSLNSQFPVVKSTHAMT